MALYAIGDTHLSLGSDKPMDVFGPGWAGYVERLREGFSAVSEEDTVVLCGAAVAVVRACPCDTRYVAAVAANGVAVAVFR